MAVQQAVPTHHPPITARMRSRGRARIVHCRLSATGPSESSSAVLRASDQSEDWHFAVSLFQVAAIAWRKFHDLIPNGIALGPGKQLCFDWELSITELTKASPGFLARLKAHAG